MPNFALPNVEFLENNIVYDNEKNISTFKQKKSK